MKPIGCSSEEDVFPNIPNVPAKRKQNRVVKNKLKRKQKSIKKVEDADEKAERIREALKLQIQLLRAKKRPKFKFVCSPPEINAVNSSQTITTSVVEEKVLRKNCRHVLETNGTNGTTSDSGGFKYSYRKEINAQLLRGDEPQVNEYNENQGKTMSKIKICDKILQSLKSEKGKDNSISMSTSNSLTIATPVSTIPIIPSLPANNFYGNSSRVILKTYDPFALATSAVVLKPYQHKSMAEKQRILEATRLPLMYFATKRQDEDNHNLVLKYRKTSKVSIESDGKIQQGVKSVVDKLLDYVDVLDETKYLHMNYESVENTTKEPPFTVSKVRPTGRRSKINKIPLELKRFNCQIVSVVNDEDNSDNKKCTKEVCKLGCICKTLRCDSKNLLPTHCGSWKCIFKCSCEANNNMDNSSLQIGCDMLNAGTINRIQDQAKKNLAKVEKEFSQTIIKTDNQLVMVENSKRRRRRR